MPQIRRLLAAISCLVLFLMGTPLASAQTANGQPSGSGLSISPTISQFTITPGSSQNLTITLKNITVDNVTAQGIVNDFTSDNVTGNPKILTNEAQPTPNSIQGFVTGLSNVPIAKGQQKNVTLTLQVPKGTAPGAYYGIIRYKAIPGNSVSPAPGQVALTASVGTIVLITVPGNLREQVQVRGIHVYRGGQDGTFFLGPPTSIGIEIANFGNGFEQPFGTVEVHNMFNKSVISYQFNNPKQPGNILPGSTRIFTNNVKGFKQVGRYTVIASVSYGKGTQVVTLEKSFWYIPKWFAVLFLVIILALIYLAYRAYRKYRHEARHSSRR